MKLIIDIPEELYTYMQSESYDAHLDKRFDYRIRFAVREGKPLPKGYGRLISTSDLDITKLVDSDIEWVMGRCDISRVQDMIDNAPTIIEADKGAIE